MSIVAALLRLMLIAVIAVGIGMPVPFSGPASAAMAQIHAVHAVHADMGAPAPVSQRAACQEHCLGGVVPVAIQAPIPRTVRVSRLFAPLTSEDAASLPLEPEKPPPRA